MAAEKIARYIRQQEESGEDMREMLKDPEKRKRAGLDFDGDWVDFYNKEEHWEVTYYSNDSVQAKECKCSVCNTIVDEEKPFCPNCKAEMKGSIYIF